MRMFYAGQKTERWLPPTRWTEDAMSVVGSRWMQVKRPNGKACKAGDDNDVLWWVRNQIPLSDK